MQYKSPYRFADYSTIPYNNELVTQQQKRTPYFSPFVICSANSDNQVKAIADEIEFKMKNDNKLSPSHIEGYNTATWILLDYNDVIVHIFNKESRMFYSLEKLWEDAKHIDISELIKEN